MKKLMLGFAALAAATCAAGGYPYRPAEMTNVSVKAGFWLPRFETNRLVTVWTDFRKCEIARIPNFTNAANRAWGTFKGIPFDDSDVYKVIEGAAYTLATHPDPKLEKYLDDLIGWIARAQEPDGYLYTARTLGFTYGKDEKGREKFGMMGPTRWSACAGSHELYNVGHMYEAAVAYYEATGKRSLLDVAIKSADLVDRTIGYGPTQIKTVPGHEEIEIGLCKLYRVTGERRYLDLAKRLIDMRGRRDLRGIWGANVQDHVPVLQQGEALGHAVRAGYLYAGMADVSAFTGDASYTAAIDRLWENVVGKKLHLNGGIGAHRHVRYRDPKLGQAGEAFGENYDLPNEKAYLETCAAIANALWNQRMFLRDGDAKYVDVLERIVYNGFLSGISLAGDEFFYENPLASQGGYKRSKWFGCSCCPVNIVRFIPQIAQFAYATRGNAAYVNLFVASDAKLAVAGGDVRLEQRTDYPWKGVSRIAVTPAKDGQPFALNVRVPGWAVGRPVPSDLYTQVVPGTLADVQVKVNGAAVAFTPVKGYCVLDRAWKKGDVVEIAMNMPVRRIRAHASVEADGGRLAVERGPVVYCAEGVDNGGSVLDKLVAEDAAFADAACEIAGSAFPALTVPAQTVRKGLKRVSCEPTTLKLIPYFAWCHRGAGEMQTWFPVRADVASAKGGFSTTASHCWEGDTLRAVCDGLLPKSSSDDTIRRMTFWPRKGSEEWIQYDLPAAETVSGVDVYWFDDEPKGGCRVPESWKVQVRETADAPWRDVAAAQPAAKDRFNALDFAPTAAKSVRLVVKNRPGFSGGVLEWRLR